MKIIKRRNSECQIKFLPWLFLDLLLLVDPFVKGKTEKERISHIQSLHWCRWWCWWDDHDTLLQMTFYSSILAESLMGESEEAAQQSQDWAWGLYVLKVDESRDANVSCVRCRAKNESWTNRDHQNDLYLFKNFSFWCSLSLSCFHMHE